MPIEVTVRHRDVSNAVQDYARSKAEKLVEEFPRVEHVHLIIDQEKHLDVAEFVVQARNHIHVEAKESADNLRLALDTACDKAERQLRKLRDKVLDHRPRNAKRPARPPEAGEAESPEGDVEP